MKEPPPNPFYYNYVFSEFDLKRTKIKWWECLYIWLFPTYVQLNGENEFHYKHIGGKYYLIKTITRR